jgi:hypothetical protein
MKKGQKPLTPQQQLANVHDSLADDVFETDIQINKGTKQRAARIVRAAMNEALGSSQSSHSEAGASQKWGKRIDKDEPPVKGPVK